LLDACLERAGLREDKDLHCEAWVLVTRATDTPNRAGGKNPLQKRQTVEAFSTIQAPRGKLEERMNQEQRLELVTKGTVEIIQPAELQRVLEEKEKPRAYWGFECSGKQPT
jgi:hypothetical protein